MRTYTYTVNNPRHKGMHTIVAKNKQDAIIRAIAFWSIWGGVNVSSFRWLKGA